MPRKIWINIPAYTGTVTAQTVTALVSEIALLMNRGDEIDLRLDCGSPYICDARAVMVQKFLEGDADTFVFIDHDVSWPIGALAALIDAPVDCRAGVYPKRCDPQEFPLLWDETKPELHADPEHGLLEVRGVPTGFLVMSRAMLQRLRDEYPALTVGTDETASGKYVAMFADWWETDPETGERNGGKLCDDYALCARWRAIGGKVWINPDISFGHTGTKTFNGNLAEWLLSR